jgi:DnaJ-class molecular chaperone
MKLRQTFFAVLALSIMFLGGRSANTEDVIGEDKKSKEAEKPVNCPQCEGTGVKIMLPCSGCARSSKPGYNNVGERLEVCQRCKGTAKCVGVWCELCNRKGKVLMSQLLPFMGGQKEAPKGQKWCPTCNGSRVSEWLPCNQCKRSKYVGYVQMGEGLMACNRCNGNAKVPGLACQTCSGRGTVKEEEPKK